MGSSTAIAVFVALGIWLLCWLIKMRSMPSPISMAVIDGDLGKLRSMLVSCTSTDKQEALFWAIFHQCDEAFDIVLDSGPDLTLPLIWGGSALHVAARCGTPHALDRLLSLDVELDQDCMGTPLYWAADAGRDDVVDRLIDCGADVYAVDVDMLGKSGFKPNFNTLEDYDRISTRIRNARGAK